MRFAIGCFCAFLLPIGHGNAAQSSGIDATLESLRAADLRLGNALFRLASGNVELCIKRAPLTGLILHGRGDYDDSVRPAAIRYFSFEAAVGVEAVVAGSPADVAGVREDDSLIAVDGMTLGSSADAREAALEAIDSAGARGPILLVLRHDGADRKVLLKPVLGCTAHAQVRVDNDLNAATDGDTIQVDSALMNLVSDEDQFAAIVAHELGHIILNHPDRLTAAHVDRGLFKGLGRSARLFKQTETEADRLSVTLMANAGYDPFAAGRYWRHYGNRLGSAGLLGGTHLKWQDRAALVEGEARSLARHTARPIVPQWIADRTEPLR